MCCVVGGKGRIPEEHRKRWGKRKETERIGRGNDKEYEGKTPKKDGRKSGKDKEEERNKEVRMEK